MAGMVLLNPWMRSEASLEDVYQALLLSTPAASRVPKKKLLTFRLGIGQSLRGFHGCTCPCPSRKPPKRVCNCRAFSKRRSTGFTGLSRLPPRSFSVAIRLAPPPEFQAAAEADMRATQRGARWSVRICSEADHATTRPPARQQAVKRQLAWSEKFAVAVVHKASTANRHLSSTYGLQGANLSLCMWAGS